ncbi:MAG: hypothetical protein LW854_23545 [Rubrivivax sp.]|jgi:hypothetical protein|nr:hypothetical protein [Rubrivivax sp.]
MTTQSTNQEEVTMKQTLLNRPRRRLLAMAAAPAMLLPAAPAHAILDWLAERAADNRRKRYDAVLDKALVDALYVLEEDGKKEGLVPALRQAGYKLNGLNIDLVAMERILFNTGNMASAEEKMRAFVPDVGADPVAALYAGAAKARGNVAKAYKPAFSGRLNRMYKQPLVFGQGRVEWFDRDLSFIEWTPEGRVVSLLLHAYQASTSMGVFLTRHSTVLLGPANARHVENNIRNSEFADFELRTL